MLNLVFADALQEASAWAACWSDEGQLQGIEHGGPEKNRV
jgi:hypothetical protein